MPNWDNDFDFDDLDDEPKKKKTVPKKSKPDDDFFDNEEADDKSKLPSIASRNQGSAKAVNVPKSSSRRNPYAENMQLRGNIYDDDEEIYEEVEEAPKKKSTQIKKDPEEDVDFYEEVADEPKKTSSKAIQKNVEPQEDNYEQEFDEDYGEDFEEVVEEPKIPSKKEAPVIHTDPQQKKKPVLSVNVTNNSKPQELPKPPSKKQIAEPNKRNQTVAKNIKPQLPRTSSRQSLKSVDSRNNISLKSKGNRFSTNASFMPNKYSNELTKMFPDVNLEEMDQQKINKLNDKVRAMIKKFNEQLNELINKNMLYLKAKKSQKSESVEDRLRILEEQRKNNETMVEYMEKQFNKLCGREGELREEEYQLMTEKKIEEIKQQIKQTQKLITKLKFEVKADGNKLSRKQEDKKMAQELHHLKTNLIQSKKDEEKQVQKIQKLDEQTLDLSEKIVDIDYKISELVEKAKQSGIQLESKEDITRRFEEIRRKVEASKNHRVKLENLLKTKSDIILHEKEQLKINIRNCSMEIKNLYSSIEHSHGQSIKVVEKAKTNPKISPNVATDLQSILRSLEVSQQDNFSVRSESNKSQSSQRPLKNSVLQNLEKSEPLRSQLAQQKTSEDPSKPNFLKKMAKMNQLGEQRKNQAYQRVWKEDENEKAANSKAQDSEQKQKERAVEEKDKKKPFNFKKNRGTVEKSEESKNDIRLDLASEKKEEEQKKQEVSLAGPKMMKFKRRGNEEKEEIKKEQKIQEQKPAEEEEKPIFAPKRFNLRNRQGQEKKEDSYVPTMEKQEPKKEEPAIKKVEEYTPKLNFGDVEDNFKKPAFDPLSKQNKEKQFVIGASKKEKQEEKKKEDEEEVKPRFNLRLRDRKKTDEDGGYLPNNQIKIGDKNQPAAVDKNSYAPTNFSNQYAPKDVQKQMHKQVSPQVVNNPYNPYAQNLANNEARKKEGPVKKPKIVPPAQKQKINIYEQAEQAEGLNQFVHETAKQKPPVYDDKEPNLNDLLGVKNKTKVDDDLADLIGGGNNKKVKKKNDFFDDMDL